MSVLTRPVIAVCVSTLLGIVVLANGANAQSFMSPVDIRSSADSDCRPAFDPNSSEVPAVYCEICAEFIVENASPQDRGLLLRELSQRRCDVEAEPFPEPDLSGFTLVFDQDAIVFDEYTDLNEDRNYTLGLGFSITGADTADNYLADLREWIDGRIGIDSLSTSNPLENVNAFDFGMTAFTPGDLEDENVIPGERPYASLFYISSAKMRAYNDGHALKTRFVLGVLGLDYAGNLQRYLHNDLGLSKKDPRGWANQISDGGELTALYAVERTEVLREDRAGWIDYDLTYTVSGNVGYYVDSAIGFDVRLGRITSPYYAHSANPLSAYNHGNCVSCRADDNFLFFSYRIRAVLYNAFLQGQFRDSTHTLDDDEIERILHEAGGGWTYHVLDGFQLTYALNYKSSEIKGAYARSHWWGGLYFSWNFE